MAQMMSQSLPLSNGRAVVCRHCTPDDAPLFAAFQQQVAQESTHTMQMVARVPDESLVRAKWDEATADPVALQLGAFCEGRLVGLCGVHPLRPLHPWTQHVARFGLMVLQEFWGSGLAQRLMEMCHEHARRKDVSRLEATVRLANARGVHFYEKLGYAIEGTRHHAARIDGEWQDEYFIAKIFPRDVAESHWQPPSLKTARLLLRPLVATDAAAIFQYASNPNVAQMTQWAPHQTTSQSLAFIQDYAWPNYRQRVPEPFGITQKCAADTVRGTVGCFWASRTDQCMELGYALAEPLWGQGLIAEAATAVLAYVFREFAVQRVQARCKVENAASARVMEKIGMHYEGTSRRSVWHNDRYWDMRHYAVLRSENVHERI